MSHGIKLLTIPRKEISNLLTFSSDRTANLPTALIKLYATLHSLFGDFKYVLCVLCVYFPLLWRNYVTSYLDRNYYFVGYCVGV